jgi:TolB protein
MTNSDPNNTDPAWSPDGKLIAFNAERDGTSQIYIMRPDGSKQTSISQSTRFDQRPCWSPDSRRLGFGAGTTDRLTVMVIGIDEPQEKSHHQTSARCARTGRWMDVGSWFSNSIHGSREL